MANVYFVSGMGASCKVFDRLELPTYYNKYYLEWRSPFKDETLEDYAKSLTMQIKLDESFILVGYSFGGIVVQEMNKFVTPKKTILIASIKDEEQRPSYFSFCQFLRIDSFIRPWFFNEKIISWFFKRFVYKTNGSIDVKEYLPQLNATYIRWAIKEILKWQPQNTIENLYQIHGTKDLTFPYKKIKSAYPDSSLHFLTIRDSGHLMVLEKPKEVSEVLCSILEEV